LKVNGKIGTIIFLGIGSNKGDRVKNLENALSLINSNVGEILSISYVYETEPWGFESNNKFLNMVAKVNTYLSPFVLMKKLQAIEIRLGRTRSLTRYTSRSIDIDILFYGSRIIRERMLTVPHPLITDRKFVLVPLCDIAPEGVHPVLRKTFSELLIECADSGCVRKYEIGEIKGWNRQSGEVETENAVR